MEIKEAKQVIEKLRKEMDDEQIIKTFIRMYLDDKMTYDQINGMINLMGYHLDASLDDLNDTVRKKVLRQSI